MSDAAAPGTRLRSGARDSTHVIHQQLRRQVLRGDLTPGSQISQAQVAAEFGVSRGPVREAFRLLERDGLIDTRINHRARVASLSVGELEHLYTMRVLNECVALSVSVPLFDGYDLDELDVLAATLTATGEDGFDFDSWDETHQRFHTLLLAHSGSEMLRSAAGWAARTRRYRRAYAEDGRGLPAGAAEHVAMAQLCRDRNAPAVEQMLARHLSRAALTLIAQMEPTHEPLLLSAALRRIFGADDRG